MSGEASAFFAGVAWTWLLGGLLGMMDLMLGRLPKEQSPVTEADVYSWLLIGMMLVVVALVLRA